MSGERKQLQIHTKVGFETVNAAMFGIWGAHRARGADGSDLDHYAVTHEPTGLCLASVTGEISRWEAEALAEQLDKAGPLEIATVGEPSRNGVYKPIGPGVAKAREIVDCGTWRQGDDE